MSFSRKAVQNGYDNKNGEQAIYLRVIIRKNKRLLPLNISWPEKYFDRQAGLVKPRHAKDLDANDYNMIITDAIAKANEIFKYFRLTKNELTIEKFIKEYNSNLSKDDFIKYYSERAKLRLRDKEITDSTYEDHMKTLRKIKLWKETISFSDIDENWAWDFDAFLKKNINSRKGDSTNDRWKHHKNVRTYLNKARNKDSINLIYPYSYFTAKLQPGSWRPIYETDVKRLWSFYNTTEFNNLRRAVRSLLFMIYTGLRVSDLQLMQPEWLTDGQIRFISQKNKRYGRHTSIPLSKDAAKLWNDAIADPGSTKYFFKYFEPQKTNEHFKTIAEKIGIESRLHNHVGRHTFITLFLKKGGPIDLASQYAGHTTLQQTMTYNHPDEERKMQAINVMDQINE